MSTVCTISVVCRDGVVRSVACHADGYLSHAGRILNTHYATWCLAEQLVLNGDMRCLRESCDCPTGHSLDTPVAGFCVFYRRDSDMDCWGNTEAREYSSVRDALVQEFQTYHYVFENGGWSVQYWDYRGRQYKALPLALRRCPE
ncbi:post-segregation killing protein PndC [Escherichia coli]|uniref:Post-segregation killing protein PndC n=2 Tax=Escherichia coli TaxID=562 RepID=A0A6L6ZKI1_ECOLX|nr:post-segregation killing protein PndC [Escherichia coli]EES4171881.1 post-segregation killing protein PndC [Escherichia coli]EFI8917264.1 post-segregation killing protein PndC [Escherichia coli]EFJ4032714.1 post-segregation killing protein PndC [Escherichia coli]EHJ6107784.1 post-segregation killing protein PndC [Escherichia coli]EIG1236015.1 post-segregation killing protein PndC [Escherichia coli]